MRLENDLSLNQLNKNLGNKIINLDFRKNGGRTQSNGKNETIKSMRSNVDLVSLGNKLNLKSNFKSIQDVESNMENVISSIMENPGFARDFVHKPLNGYRVEALLGL